MSENGAPQGASERRMEWGRRVAREWSEWLANEEGRACADAATLGHDPKYLENRLWRAFMAGADARRYAPHDGQGYEIRPDGVLMCHTTANDTVEGSDV